jgi:hypothetical protein
MDSHVSKKNKGEKIGAGLSRKEVSRWVLNTGPELTEQDSVEPDWVKDFVNGKVGAAQREVREKIGELEEKIGLVENLPAVFQTFVSDFGRLEEQREQQVQVEKGKFSQMNVAQQELADKMCQLETVTTGELVKLMKKVDEVEKYSNHLASLLTNQERSHREAFGKFERAQRQRLEDFGEALERQSRTLERQNEQIETLGRELENLGRQVTSLLGKEIGQREAIETVRNFNSNAINNVPKSSRNVSETRNLVGREEMEYRDDYPLEDVRGDLDDRHDRREEYRNWIPVRNRNQDQDRYYDRNRNRNQNGNRDQNRNQGARIRNMPKLEQYDGKYPWKDFENKFRQHAFICGWEEDIMSAMLNISLSGTALHYF